MTPPIPIRGRNKSVAKPLDFDALDRAISTAKAALQLFTVGAPIIRRGPEGDIHVDVPVMYMNFAIDRIHYDPQSEAPSPKGRPTKAYIDVDSQKIREKIEKVLKEAYVIEAAEFREPEEAWIIPVAWNRLIIMHIKVSENGEELVPDYGLTDEVRRHID